MNRMLIINEILKKLTPSTNPIETALKQLGDVALLSLANDLGINTDEILTHKEVR